MGAKSGGTTDLSVAQFGLICPTAEKLSQNYRLVDTWMIMPARSANLTPLDFLYGNMKDCRVERIIGIEWSYETFQAFKYVLESFDDSRMVELRTLLMGEQKFILFREG